MTTIRITKKYDIRRTEEHLVNADDLTPEQRELLETSIAETDVIDSKQGLENSELESIIANAAETEHSDDVPDFPEIVYTIEDAGISSAMKWPTGTTHVTATTVDEDGTKTVTNRPLNPLQAAQALAEAWSNNHPMEQEEIFYNLGCDEVQPLIDLFRSLGADTLASNVEYAHARCDHDEEYDQHHGLYLKRKAAGDL